MTKRKSTVKLLTLLVFTALIVAACVNDTSYPGTMNVIEADQVLSQMEGAVVIDARGQEAYDKGHLEGAVSLSPAELVTDVPVPSTLAPKEQVEAVLGSKGIDQNTTLYVYDDNMGVSAARIWWTVKVYSPQQTVQIVNGGASALVNAGAPLSADATVLPETTYEAQEADTSIIATYEEVKALSEAPQDDVKILDVRSAAEYAAGYIPTAINYAHTKNLYSDGTFMSSRDLGLFYKDLGLSKDDEIILYCKSSFRAAQTYALLDEAGYSNLKIYDGAWLEWEQQGAPATPVEQAVPVTQQEGS
ncbi:sulfurtransferase [Fusibacter paucivorans]|uniref:thiosulfate sulfurtransferase n=1 Tax=Fusibacter paucivorans TaxID=76009 RepID=A0ABS5PK73_9FIRM|nr:rhodanese-like domain-containing protein [Fusibacter paucivorans]MBS7525564.1 sulfurtransferase [Fusibacter paucivorans]